MSTAHDEDNSKLFSCFFRVVLDVSILTLPWYFWNYFDNIPLLFHSSNLIYTKFKKRFQTRHYLNIPLDYRLLHKIFF